MRLRRKASARNLPGDHNPKPRQPSPPQGGALLSVRAAVILGSSLAIAGATGALTYLAGARHGADMSAAGGAALAAFLVAVKLLSEIIGD